MKIDSKHAYMHKTIDKSKYGLLNVSSPDIKTISIEEAKEGNPGYVFVPYIIVSTHAEISDKNGTRRIRQVTRWSLVKLWIYGRIFKIFKFFNKEDLLSKYKIVKYFYPKNRKW